MMAMIVPFWEYEELRHIEILLKLRYSLRSLPIQPEHSWRFFAFLQGLFFII